MTRPSLLVSLSLLTLSATLPAADPPPPFLLNGDFSAKSLKPWSCDEGKLAPDPKNPKNQTLLIDLEDGVFGLTQDLPKKLPTPFPAHLVLRAFADKASKDEPIQLRFRWVDAEGNSEVFATYDLETSGRWIPLKLLSPKPELKAVSILIESNRGEGKLWLDDLKFR